MELKNWQIIGLGIAGVGIIIQTRAVDYYDLFKGTELHYGSQVDVQYWQFYNFMCSRTWNIQYSHHSDCRGKHNIRYLLLRLLRRSSWK